MNKIIISKTGYFLIDDYSLPALVQSINIGGKAIFDSSNVEGTSGKKRVFNGFDDTDISLVLIILERRKNDRYKALEKITAIFKKLEDSQPVIYNLEAAIVQAFKVKQVQFIDLKAEEQNGNDSLQVTLTFQEHNPVVAIVQEQQQTIQQPQNDDSVSHQKFENEILNQ